MISEKCQDFTALESLFRLKDGMEISSIKLKYHQDPMLDIFIEFSDNTLSHSVLFKNCHRFEFFHNTNLNGCYILYDLRDRQLENINYSIDEDGGSFSFLFEKFEFLE